MTYEFMELTPQIATSHWGWTIAFFLWFIGLSGMGLVINAWLKSRRLLYICCAAAILGTLLVLSHLGRLLNLPVAAFYALIEWKFNFSSWMFIGICILAVLCVITVLQSWAAWAAGKKGKTCPFASSPIMRIVDAVLGIAATAYSGFLLTQAVGVPLWTTAVLPVLWIFSGAASAMGIVEVMAATGKLEGGHPGWMPRTSLLIHIGEAFVLFAFVHVAFFGTPGAMAGAQSLLWGAEALLFWGGAVVVGIVLPIACGWIKNPATAVAGGFLAFLGALALRASVLFAGYFDPIIF